MGRALVEAALALGHEVIVVTGPVEIDYPPAARVVPVISTEEMLAAAAHIFESCDGLIGAAAPCDYRPVRVEDHKIAKTGRPVDLHLVETEDVVRDARPAEGESLGCRLCTRNRRPPAACAGEARAEALRSGGLERRRSDQLARQSCGSLGHRWHGTGRARREQGIGRQGDPGPRAKAADRGSRSVGLSRGGAQVASCC